MAMLEELERQIGVAEKELHDAVGRLRSFAELEASLASATGGVKEGAEGLARLSEHLGETTRQLQQALGEFMGAAEAVKNANPETLTAGVASVQETVERVVAVSDRMHDETGRFHATLKEELGEQRESLERRILAVESGLEQARSQLGQLKNRLEEGLEEAAEASLDLGRSLRPWLILIVLLLLTIVVGVGWPYYQQVRDAEIKVGGGFGAIFDTLAASSVDAALAERSGNEPRPLR
ncbi:MAG: hypothetical protein KDK91_01490 [Gammaproteobacteria bacterium]|nr:hypothetical protein [Gammaproteobacteria bacterium]